jgi:uncharacterized protein involved in tolerance to divalent cations
LRTKICPYCREPIRRLVKLEINDDGTENEIIVFPRQLGVETLDNIHVLMETILASLPRRGEQFFYEWKDSIDNNDSEWIHIVKDEISKLSEDEIKAMFVKFSKYSPNIIFMNLKKFFTEYYKKRTGIKIAVKRGMDIEIIKLFLAYTIVVEAPVVNYINRVNGYFGW